MDCDSDSDAGGQVDHLQPELEAGGMMAVDTVDADVDADASSRTTEKPHCRHRDGRKRFDPRQPREATVQADVPSETARSSSLSSALMAPSSACKDGHLHEEVGEEVEEEVLMVYDADVDESGHVDDHHQHPFHDESLLGFRNEDPTAGIDGIHSGGGAGDGMTSSVVVGATEPTTTSSSANHLHPDRTPLRSRLSTPRLSTTGDESNKRRRVVTSDGGSQAVAVSAASLSTVLPDDGDEVEELAVVQERSTVPQRPNDKVPKASQKERNDGAMASSVVDSTSTPGWESNGTAVNGIASAHATNGGAENKTKNGKPPRYPDHVARAKVSLF
jgi:hypothetical protein